jgi:ubiquinone/menaquinone biosynthesis C-methylase UbiE
MSGLDMVAYPYDACAYEKRYSKVYEAGAAFWEKFTPTKALADFLHEWKPAKGLKAVDMGCGEGRDSIFLAHEGFDVTGIDSSRSGIKRAKTRAKAEGANVDFMVADVTNLPMKDGTCDLSINIACLQMIIHQYTRDKHLREAHRLLRNGGIYFSCNGAVEKPLSIEEFYKQLGKQPGDPVSREIEVEGDGKEIFLPIIPAWLKSKEEYIEEFERADFRVVKLYREYVEPDHDWWVLIAEKPKA